MTIDSPSNNLEDSVIDYPEFIELENIDKEIEKDDSINNLFVKNKNLKGGAYNEETSIDLPEDIEVISFE